MHNMTNRETIIALEHSDDAVVRMLCTRLKHAVGYEADDAVTSAEAGAMYAALEGGKN